MRPRRSSVFALALTSFVSFVACGDDLSGGAGDTPTTSATTPDGGGSSQTGQPLPGTSTGRPDGGGTTPETPITTDGTCGAGKAPCADGLPCGAPPDCTSGVCTGNICQLPGGKDGVKNGDESDTDCGGTAAGTKRCDVGAACNTHADCTDGCGEVTKTCVFGKSCWKHLGGDTCAAGENCCQTAIVAGTTAKMDRFQVTAGRMRGMIERLNGDVRTFVGTLPAAAWKPAWSKLVPSSIAEANLMLGPYWENAPNAQKSYWSKQSCQSNIADAQYTGHTYKVPGDESDFSQANLDPKALNCVGWHMANAFCQWEGGRLPTSNEFNLAHTNDRKTDWPWGDTPKANFGTDDNPKIDPHGNHHYDFEGPVVPGMRYVNGQAIDAAFYMAPPGHYPTNFNGNGIADLVGDMMPWVSDLGRDGTPVTSFLWTYSWENHAAWWDGTKDASPAKNASLHVSQWTDPDEAAGQDVPNGYYAIGFRCVHD